MSPHIHSRIHSKKFGGVPEDYLPIDEFIDSSKTHHPDIRHRAILHSSFGIYLTERVFGATITNSVGKQICVREIVIDHVIQDLGFIPTMEQYLKHMSLEGWMSGSDKKNPLAEKKKQVSIKKLPFPMHKEPLKPTIKPSTPWPEFQPFLVPYHNPVAPYRNPGDVYD